MPGRGLLAVGFVAGEVQGVLRCSGGPGLAGRGVRPAAVVFAVAGSVVTTVRAGTGPDRLAGVVPSWAGPPRVKRRVG
jgi:hypothetical protein